MADTLATAEALGRRNLVAYLRGGGNGNGRSLEPDRSGEFDERLRKLEEAQRAGGESAPSASVPAEEAEQTPSVPWAD